MKDWDYAKMSKFASELGGPKEMIRIITKAGINQGRIQMLPFSLLLAGISSAVTWYIMRKNKKAEEEAQRAEVQILKQYDTITDGLTTDNNDS